MADERAHCCWLCHGARGRTLELDLEVRTGRLRTAAFHSLQLAAQPEAVAAVAEEGHTARRLTDDYEVHEEIGRGAFSYVRRVTEKSSGLDYAAKFIPCRVKAKQSARRELQILSQLDHERLVYFHDSFEKKNAVIIVMELCTEEELLDRMARKPSVCEWEVSAGPGAACRAPHPPPASTCWSPRELQGQGPRTNPWGPGFSPGVTECEGVRALHPHFLRVTGTLSQAVTQKVY
ncbi:striated muscle preferentially expressed protein kinase-like [Chelonoidis abingdonii]|uniref:striated muscle preferentially expressed protein kinase-like n=1 Tax=Chelonoidis abingdonii TaxID=106734 RepID=UPI003F49ABCC